MQTCQLHAKILVTVSKKIQYIYSKFSYTLQINMFVHISVSQNA